MRRSSFSRYRAHPAIISERLYAQRNVNIESCTGSTSTSTSSAQESSSTATASTLPNFPSVLAGSPTSTASPSNTHIPRKFKDETYFLARVILEILAYTYGVDLFELEVALVGGSQFSNFRMVNNCDGRRSLLNHDDEVLACHVGNTAARMCAIVERTQSCRYEKDGGPKLMQYILQPAQDFDMEPAYFLEKIMEYRNHRCKANKRKESLPYKDMSSFSLFGRDIFAKKWMTEAQHKTLARRLISDRIALSVISPTDEATSLLGAAITQFANKHCKINMNQINKRIHVESLPAVVVLTIWQAYIAQRNEQVKQSGSSITARTRTLNDLGESIAQLRQGVNGIRKTALINSQTASTSSANKDSTPISLVQRLSHGDLREMATEKKTKSPNLRRVQSSTENGGDFAKAFWSGFD